MPDPTGTRPASWQDVISAEATKQGIDPRLALAVADTESSFNPAAKSPKGALGLMQLMPETAQRLGVDPADPIQNIRGGVSELKRLIDEHQGDVVMALRRYNGSPTAPETATQPYVDRVLGKLQGQPKAGTSGGPTLGKASTQIATPPTQAILPPDRRANPRATPPSAEDFMTTGQKAERAIGNVAAELGAGVDPRTPTGRRNLAGGAGAAVATALVPVTGGLSAAAAGVLGAAAGGMTAEAGEQLVGTKPPSSTAVVGAGAQQGAYELAGQGLLWPAKALGRRILATQVGQAAHGALTAARRATTERLADLLDNASAAAGDVRRLASDTVRATRRSVADSLRTARTTAQTGVEAAQTRAASVIGQAPDDLMSQARRSVADSLRTARQGAQAGVEAAQTQGAQDIERATAQAGAASQVAQAPYLALAGSAPSPAAAGRVADSVIRGPAQEARDILGKQVDEAARSGPKVDITDLQKEAQRVVDQIAKPETAFPRKVAEGADQGVGAGVAASFKDQFGISIDQAAKDPKYAGLVERYKAQLAPTELASAQAEAARETLKHPAMGVLNRILNADPIVDFYDLHLFKTQLDDALQGTQDKVIKKQVVSLTQHIRAGVREALAGHQPYNQATAAYASIVPLYTKETAAAFRKAAATDPEALVRMIKPGKPTALRMLRDLLVTQSAVAGKEAEGQTAWDTVRAAWTHQNLLKGGIEKLEGNLAALPEEFRGVFFGDPKGQQVLQNLQQISAAYKAASAAGEAGISAAKTSAESAVDAARATGKSSVEAARATGQATLEKTQRLQGALRDSAQSEIDAARAAGKATVDQTRQVGQASIERSIQQGNAAKAQAAADVRAARRAKQTFAKTPTTQEQRFAASSLAGRQPTMEELAAHGIRAVGLGPFQLWGGLSWMKLLTGPEEKDLIEWAAYSPQNTQRLVSLMTGPSPTGMAVADLLRSAGLLERKTPQKTDAIGPRVGQPPPR